MYYTFQNRKSKNTKLLLFFKFLVILFFLIIIYGIYLDIKIKRFIESKILQLPNTVYSRIINLEPGMYYRIGDMIDLLKKMQYREVLNITGPGQYIKHHNIIELSRRSFDFPDNKEGCFNVCIKFDNDHLVEIKNKDSGRNFAIFRFDPQLINILQKSNDEKQRFFLPKNKFPEILINILITIEDKNFYKHDGVNVPSILRALLVNFIYGKTVQGGSTLTQQLVKNLFLTNQKSIWRKVNEIYMALILDYRYSKDLILEFYLNEVYFGQIGNSQIRGFPLASLYYFGKLLEELTIDQYATLVGMIKGASLYNPWRNPELVLERRNLILKLLENKNLINNELLKMLINNPLGVINRKDNLITSQPSFMQKVHSELKVKLGENIKNFSGLRIFTTLDLISQNAAEQAVLKGISKLRKKHKIQDLEVAMVVVDRFNGEIRAMVGGANPFFAGFNRAMQARRSIGSLAKPAIYLTALGEPDKFRLNTKILDIPIFVKQSGGYFWSPRNFDRKFRGNIILIDAFTNSLNAPAVHLGLSLGLKRISNTLIKLGIPSYKLTNLPSMLLGSINLTPIEVAQKFQTIASGGNYASLFSIKSIVEKNNSILLYNFPKITKTISSQASFLILYAMQKVVEQGTSNFLYNKFSYFNLAAKTGTSNDTRDSWFVGIDDEEVSITWVGRDNNQPTNLTGANGALFIYYEYLNNRSPKKLNLIPPEGIKYVSVDLNGNFICKDTCTEYKIPVWIEDVKSLCNLNS